MRDHRFNVGSLSHKVQLFIKKHGNMPHREIKNGLEKEGVFVDYSLINYVRTKMELPKIEVSRKTTPADALRKLASSLRQVADILEETLGKEAA
jgi:hypothetical protein